MSKTEDEAYNLIEEIVINNYQGSNKRGQAKSIGGKFDVDALTLLTAKIDGITQRLDKLNVNAMNSCALFPTCDKCGSHDHMNENCQVGKPFAPSPSDNVAYVNNFQPKLNHNPYSNTYNPSWKHHPNFSYRIEPLPFPQANVRPTPPRFQRPPFPL